MNIDWGTFFISVPSTLLIVGAAVKFLSKVYVDQLFKKALEDHKHDLQMIVENNKFDIQRKMHDFSLYASKKHSIYADLYGLFLNAEKMSKRMMGFREMPNYIAYSGKELEYALRNKGIPEVKIEYYVEGWNSYKSTKIDDLKMYIQFFEINEAKLAFSESKDKFHNSRLYLSEKVTEICHKTTEVMWNLIVDLELVLDKDIIGYDKSKFRKSYEINKKELNELLLNLQIEMQKEISVGYYEKKQ